ncbi:MAG: SGNH/GDSL hydrolase family protein [Verrucomicrobiota bacterium]|nr:SGNH/GDSL hydrolase family protein [Verrucomicrobiota bacterium]
MELKLQNNERILFIGDSITDCGRSTNEYRPLGQGYVHLFSDIMSVREPEKNIDIINTGIAGHTINDLRNRWITDAISYSPDWLSIKIGINDCKRWLSDGEAVYGPEKYVEIYDELLGLTIKELPGVKLLLIDPFYASLDVDGKLPESYRGKVVAELPKYLDTVQKMSEKYGTKHIKIHELYQNHFKKADPKVFFPNEPVHPNSAGHLLIAEAVYEELI